MKRYFIRLWEFGKDFLADQSGPELKRSYLGRVIGTLQFAAVITCLGLWIGTFGLVKSYLSKQIFSENILTDLTCITFFGGIAVSVFVGAIAGNLLQRVFWKNLTTRKK